MLKPNLQTSPPTSPRFTSTEEDIMSIPISDSLRQWLETKNLQGYIRIAEATPHPNTAKLVQQIDIAKITNKQVRRILNLKREGFDVLQKMDKETLQSYFGEYSPSAKAFQTMGGHDEFFHEVAKFILEVAFVTPRFYGMPKKRACSIIATYEGKIFDWGLLSAKALRDQLYGVQQKGKLMKTIFARWLSVLFPPQSSENRQEERRQSRARRPVPEEESVQAETIQPEREQQQLVQSPVPETTPNPPTNSVPISPPTKPIPESTPVEQTTASQWRPRMKQKAQQFRKRSRRSQHRRGEERSSRPHNLLRFQNQYDPPQPILYPLQQQRSLVSIPMTRLEFKKGNHRWL